MTNSETVPTVQLCTPELKLQRIYTIQNKHNASTSLNGLGSSDLPPPSSPWLLQNRRAAEGACSQHNDGVGG